MERLVRTSGVGALERPFHRSREVVEVSVIPQVDSLVFEAAPKAFDEGPGLEGAITGRRSDC